MNIKITIDAPELASALESLATALSSMNNSLPLETSITAKSNETKVADKEKLDNSKEEKYVKEDKKPEPAKEEPKVELEKDGKEEQTISLEVVRGKLADFSAGGKENQVKVMDALSRFGVKKLTDVESSDYKELLELVGLSA